MGTPGSHPKIDFKKTERKFYSGKVGRYDDILVPPMKYLMIDGSGPPGSPAHAFAIAALYSIAYPAKFMSKSAGRDYVVPPLQGLWWAEDHRVFVTDDRDAWQWTMMIRQPEWIEKSTVKDAQSLALDKLAKKQEPATDAETLNRVRFETLDEGQCIQILHVGPYSDEGPILAKLHNEIVPERGFALTGKHHEIYLNDFRKIAPEKLKTILRQPVTKA